VRPRGLAPAAAAGHTARAGSTCFCGRAAACGLCGSTCACGRVAARGPGGGGRFPSGGVEEHEERPPVAAVGKDKVKELGFSAISFLYGADEVYSR
jgi:hypothetical protein